MDNTIAGYVGMKGLIDLRVADILAKQAAMQHKAAMFQAHVAQHEADKAALHTAEAEANEANAAIKLPHSSTWYEPSEVSHLKYGKKLMTIRPSELPKTPDSAGGTFGGGGMFRRGVGYVQLLLSIPVSETDRRYIYSQFI